MPYRVPPADEAKCLEFLASTVFCLSDLQTDDDTEGDDFDEGPPLVHLDRFYGQKSRSAKVWTRGDLIRAGSPEVLWESAADIAVTTAGKYQLRLWLAENQQKKCRFATVPDVLSERATAGDAAAAPIRDLAVQLRGVSESVLKRVDVMDLERGKAHRELIGLMERGHERDLAFRDESGDAMLDAMVTCEVLAVKLEHERDRARNDLVTILMPAILPAIGPALTELIGGLSKLAGALALKWSMGAQTPAPVPAAKADAAVLDTLSALTTVLQEQSAALAQQGQTLAALRADLDAMRGANTEGQAEPAPDGQVDQTQAPYGVECPHCGSAAGVLCVVPAGGYRTDPHSKRSAAAVA
jgi:uncharacterized coiled-coil protein SlyX